jgi:hypothetical protein
MFAQQKTQLVGGRALQSVGGFAPQTFGNSHMRQIVNATSPSGIWIEIDEVSISIGISRAIFETILCISFNCSIRSRIFSVNLSSSCLRL